MIVEKSPTEKEPKVPKNPEIPEEQVTLEKGYYQCVYVMPSFKKEICVDIKEYQSDVEDDPDEEYTEDTELDNDRERHCSMVFEDNDGGVGYKKEFIHAKRWAVYANET